MKNKQINKFLLMFFISFTLFFSVSRAEFSTTPLTYGNALGGSGNFSSVYCGDYTYNQIKQITYNRFINESDSYIAVFDTMIESLTEDGFKLLVIRPNDSSKNYQMFIGYSNISIGAYTNTSGKLQLYFAQIDDTITEGEENRVRKFTINTMADTRGSFVLVNGSPDYGYATDLDYTIAYSNVDVKQIVLSGGPTWDGKTYFYQGSSEPEIPLMSDSEFSAMLEEITTSELFYQNIPSNYRSNFYVQYDVENDKYLFYFYPSNYQVNGLKRNENDYHIFCDADFSWWDNVVNFLKKTFNRETENLDYKMIYVSVLEDGTYSCWYRSKSMLSVDETLFNFDLNPIVYSSVQIPFYGKHGGGSINLDTGDVTLATEPEQVINDEVYGESNIVYNPNPIETIPNEQAFWDKVVNRLASIVSYIKDLPGEIISIYQSKMGFSTLISIALPLVNGILTILDIFISSISLISRAVTFVYTLPTIEASRALFDVDVSSTENLVFSGTNWGVRFLEGLDFLRNLSWNGLNLWNLFSAFITAVFAIQVIKYVRKHYHY